jgi:hypothetical protein
VNALKNCLTPQGTVGKQPKIRYFANQQKEKEINSDMLPNRQEGFADLCTMDMCFSAIRYPSNSV